MKTIGGKKYIFDGRGYIPHVESEENGYITAETDPVYSREKHLFAKKNEVLTSDYLSGFERTPQFEETVYRTNAAYQGDFIVIKNIGIGKVCKVRKLTVRTSWGDVAANCRVVYDAGVALLQCEELSRAANWEFFTIAYDVLQNDKTYVPDLRGKIGRNYMQDEDSGSGYHSTQMRQFFESAYAQLGGTARKALESRVLEGGSILQDKTDEMAVKHEFNILGRPYFDAARNEDVSSCPDILTVAAHYGNFFYPGAIAAGQHGKMSNTIQNEGDRKDITTSASEFLKNTIAVSSGLNDDGTDLWSSYGFGVEFFEAFGMPAFRERYPAENIYREQAQVFTVDSRTLKTTIQTHWAENYQPGRRLWLRYGAPEDDVEVIITEVVDSATVKIDRDVELIPAPGIYVYGYQGMWQSHGGLAHQSPVCSIVAAKFAVIQDRTNANWQLVREAARMTASNSTLQTIDGKKVYTTNWDMKRGFGIVDVDKAVEYIKENYLDNKEYVKSAVSVLPRANPLLTFNDLSGENYVSKKQLLDNVQTVRNFVSNKASKWSPYSDSTVIASSNGLRIVGKNGTSYTGMLSSLYETLDAKREVEISFMITNNGNQDIQVGFWCNGNSGLKSQAIKPNSGRNFFRQTIIPADYQENKREFMYIYIYADGVADFTVEEMYVAYTKTFIKAQED